MKSLTRWRPFGEVDTLQNEMNQLFDRFLGRDFEPEGGAALVAFPRTNVSETPDNIVVTAELPGLDSKDIDISITGDLLTLKGEKKQERDEQNESWHRIERSYGSFSRSFRLPGNVVPDKVAADFKNGVLRVTLPKSEDSKRREVKVKVS